MFKLGNRGVFTLIVAGLSLVVAARRLNRLDLRGRVAIVTGGGRGLGLAITDELLRRGCRVAVCGRDGSVIRRCVEHYERQGYEIFGHACDASDSEQVNVFVEAVLAKYGQIDVLVNNAGQCYVGPAPELQALDMQLALRNIFWVQFHPTMAVLPHMRARGFGRIANVTSIGGKLPVPHQAAYVAGKYAATGWSQTLRAELWNEGISVSTITPPPLRDGAPLHAHFNGRREDELAWFARALTSPLSSASARRTAQVVVQAITYGEGERAVSLLGWVLARSFGAAPNLVSRGLARLNRSLPPAGPPQASSPMRLGSSVARASRDAALHELVRRAEADEARHAPAGELGRVS